MSRMIDYLRISVTDHCNFRCFYCLPEGGAPLLLDRRVLTSGQIIAFTRAAAAAGISRVRITGGEPLLRPGLPGLLHSLRGIPGIRDLSLTTNGSRLAALAPELKAAGLDRINVSVDSLDPGRFASITRGGDLEQVMAGLRAALAAGIEPVKVNAVLLEGIEADLRDFVELARRLPVHVRFIEFMPIGMRRGGIWKFVPRRRILEALRQFGGLEPVNAPAGGGPARYYRMAGARGTLGFISSMSDHFCGECNRLRLTADGRLRNCLFSYEEVDMRRFLDGPQDDLTRAIRDSMNSKKFDRRGADPGPRTMSQIGG